MAQPDFSLKQKHYAILNFAGVAVDPYIRSNRDQQDRLKNILMQGLYFFNNTLQYWVTRKGKDCFALYAGMLDITGSDDPWSWKWYRVQEDQRYNTSEAVARPQVDVAESDNVRWLEVGARFSSVNLQQNTSYRVSFKVKVTKEQMQNTPLYVSLVLPDGSKQENPKSVQDLNRWVDLEAGSFTTSYNTVGILYISLRQTDPSWKRGLVIKCVEITGVDSM